MSKGWILRIVLLAAVCAAAFVTGCDTYVAISPDGKTLAWLEVDTDPGPQGGGQRLCVAPAADPGAKKVVVDVDGGPTTPWFSPDSKALYYISITGAQGAEGLQFDARLKRRELESGRTEDVVWIASATVGEDVVMPTASFAYACHYAFSPDLKYLALAGPDAGGTKLTVRVLKMPAKKELWCRKFAFGEMSLMGNPVWNHDGSVVGTVETSETEGEFVFRVFEAATGKERYTVRTKSGSSPIYAFYPKSQDIVVIDTGTIMAVNPLRKFRKTLATSFEEYNDTERLAFSPSGKKLAVVRGGGDLVQMLQFDQKTVYIINLKSMEKRPVARRVVIFGSPVWAPDESYILFGHIYNGFVKIDPNKTVDLY